MRKPDTLALRQIIRGKIGVDEYATIVGEGSPLPCLSPYGKIVDGWIQKISEKYPKASVDCYVIMPNHIHILLSIVKDDGRGNPSPTEKTSDSSHKYNTPVSPWKGEAGVFFGAHAAPRFVIPHKTRLYMQVYIHKNRENLP